MDASQGELVLHYHTRPGDGVGVLRHIDAGDDLDFHSDLYDGGTALHAATIHPHGFNAKICAYRNKR